MTTPELIDQYEDRIHIVLRHDIASEIRKKINIFHTEKATLSLSEDSSIVSNKTGELLSDILVRLCSFQSQRVIVKVYSDGSLVMEIPPQETNNGSPGSN